MSIKSRRHQHHRAGLYRQSLFDPRRRFKGGGSSAPPSVDPTALAQAQGNANVATAAAQAALNNINTTSPLGSTIFTPYGTGPNGIGPAGYTLSQTLDPSLQGLFGNQANLDTALAGNAANLAGVVNSPAQGGADIVNNAVARLGNQIPTGPVDFNGLPSLQTGGTIGPIQSSLNFTGLTPIPTSASDFSNEVKRAQDAAYNTQTGYLDPQFAQKHSDLTQQLADQGITAGSDAYDRAQGDLDRQETLAYQQAKDAAVAAGNQEQQTLFGENLASRQQGVGETQAQGNFANTAQQLGYGETAQNAGLNNQARQQGANERITQWGEPLAALAQATNTGEGILGGTTSDLATLNGLGNFAWAGQLPTFGGSPTTVAPANVVGAQQTANSAALNRFAAANTLNNQLFNGLGTVGGALGNSGLLGGSGGIFSAGGLLGSQGPLFGTAADASIAAGGPPLALEAAGSSGWIVCTELMRQGKMPKRHWIAGSPVFAAYPEKGKNGYYVWAVPTVRHLRKHPDSLFSKAVGAAFRWRAEDIAARHGVPGARKLWRGRAVTAVLYPICKALGYVVGPQDWQKLYREERAA